MNIIITAGPQPYVQQGFTSTDSTLLKNALNEVNQGIALEGEFELRMGVSREEARSLLGHLQNHVA